MEKTALWEPIGPCLDEVVAELVLFDVVGFSELLHEILVLLLEAHGVELLASVLDLPRVLALPAVQIVKKTSHTPWCYRVSKPTSVG